MTKSRTKLRYDRRKQLFLKYFFAHGIGAQAARDAGYEVSGENAYASLAHRLKKEPDIAAAIQAHEDGLVSDLKKEVGKSIMDKTELLETVTEVIRTGKKFNPGQIKALDVLSKYFGFHIENAGDQEKFESIYSRITSTVPYVARPEQELGTTKDPPRDIPADYVPGIPDEDQLPPEPSQEQPEEIHPEPIMPPEYPITTPGQDESIKEDEQPI